MNNNNKKQYKTMLISKTTTEFTREVVHGINDFAWLMIFFSWFMYMAIAIFGSNKK